MPGGGTERDRNTTGALPPFHRSAFDLRGYLMPHRRTVRSREPEASNAPSGEKATLFTALVCPESVRMSEPSATRHSHTAFSPSSTVAFLRPNRPRSSSRDVLPLPDANTRPSGAKATLCRVLWGCSSVRRSWTRLAFHCLPRYLIERRIPVLCKTYQGREFVYAN